MPLNKKGKEIMRNMKETYGNRAKEVFYRSINAGVISGVEKRGKSKGEKHASKKTG